MASNKRHYTSSDRRPISGKHSRQRASPMNVEQRSPSFRSDWRSPASNPSVWPSIGGSFEDLVSEMPDEVEEVQEDTTLPDKKNLKWSNEMDDLLVDSLLEQMLKGQKIGGTFTGTAYRVVSKNVSGRFGVTCDSTHVKNRVKTMKKNLGLAKDILCFGSGFGYNQSTQMIEASAGAWKDYLKAKPKASHFRHTPVRNYDKLCQLFGKDRATGSRAVGPKERQLQWARKQNSLNDDDSDQPEDFNETETQQEEPNTEATSSFIPHSTSKAAKEMKKKKTSLVDIVSEEIMSIKSGLDAVAAALDRGNVRNYTEEKLFEAIANIGGMSEISQMKLYQVLSRDVNDARAFLACPVERRRLWLSVKNGSSFFDV